MRRFSTMSPRSDEEHYLGCLVGLAVGDAIGTAVVFSTAAICGQLAGAHYGLSAIPARWRERLALRDDVEGFARDLLARRER